MARFQPALLGGLFIGVMSSLPIVGAANMCCCLWVITGGLLTVYLQQQARPEPVDTADAVLGGLIAGLIGAVIAWGALVAFTNFNDPAWQEQFRTQLEESPGMTPEMRDQVLGLFTGRNIALMFGVVMIPAYAVAGMLGSLLGLAIFRKKQPPVAQG